MEIQVIEKTNGRINRVTGTTIKERLRVCAYENDKIIRYGRIIGDKTIFLYIQDIMVIPE